MLQSQQRVNFRLHTARHPHLNVKANVNEGFSDLWGWLSPVHLINSSVPSFDIYVVQFKIILPDNIVDYFNIDWVSTAKVVNQKFLLLEPIILVFFAAAG